MTHNVNVLSTILQETAISEMKVQYDADMTQKLTSQRTELQTAWQNERRDILIQVESEKNHTLQQYAEEKADILTR